jgi:hypothetical protein
MQLKRSSSLSHLVALLGGFALLVSAPSSSWAQEDEDEEDDEDDDEDYEDEDEDDEEDSEDLDGETRKRPQRKSTRSARKKQDDAPSREVVKGAYAKINIGPVIWLLPSGGYLSNPGTKIDFAFGYDFIDRLSFTMSVEGAFYNMISNGTGVSECGLGPVPCPTPTGTSPTQGDLRVIGGTVALRFGPNFGGKRTKRGHFGVKIGAGVGYSPPLVDLQDPEIISRTGLPPTGSGNANVVQGRPLILVTPAVVIEGYTKLSHFSLGLEVGGDIVLLGPNPLIGLVITAALKYTF